MNLLSAFGFHKRANVQALSPRVLPPPRQDSVALEEIIGLDAVYRAVAYLQTLAGQLTIDATRANRPITSPLIDRPDPWLTQRQWITQTVAALTLTGNAYWQISRDAADAIVALRNLDPSRVSVTVDSAQITHYSVDGNEVNTRDIAHLRYMIVPGHALGLGPIQAAKCIKGDW